MRWRDSRILPNMSERLPFGDAGKLDSEESKVFAAEVKNETLWVNPEMELPFKLDVGKPSPLGLFFSQDEIPDISRLVRVHPGHYRSALLGRAIFQDKQGRSYRDIDVKGIGVLASKVSGLAVDTPLGARRESGIEGLALLDYAEHDRDMTEEFLRQGIRTYRVVAIIELNEIVEGNKVTSVAELRRRGANYSLAHGERVYPEEHEIPVIEVRAYPTKMRVADVRLKGALEDALALISEEMNLKTPMNQSEYLSWFAETIGTQVGRMHKLGYTHNYLTGHNLTLDGRIIDLDSVEHNSKLDPMEHLGRTQKDVERAKRTVLQLAADLHNDTVDAALANSLAKIYNESYSAEAGPEI